MGVPSGAVMPGIISDAAQRVRRVGTNEMWCVWRSRVGVCSVCGDLAQLCACSPICGCDVNAF